MENILNFLIIIILVALNGFFVAIEFAVIAARRSRIELLAQDGNRAAQIVKSWVESPAARDRLIAAAQLGITIASLALGSVGENTFETLLEPYFHDLTLPPAFQFLSTMLLALPLILSLIITTSLHVVLGEQVPKVAALYQPEKTATLMARPMLIFSTVFKYFVDVLDWSTRQILKLFGLEAVGEHSLIYTLDELKQIVSESERGGVLPEHGRAMVHAVLDFGELVVRQVMLPRTEVVGIQADTPYAEIVSRVREHSISKFPIYEGNLDQITGILHIKDLLHILDSPEDQSLTARSLAKEAIFVPESLHVNDLLIRFRDRRQHIAIVLDEYGGTAGLVTLEDLLEEIVGEVSDPFDPDLAEILARPDGTYLIEGLVLIADVNEYLLLDLHDPAYDTIAGYMLGKLGRIPQVGDQIEIAGVRLKVEKMDALRIDRIVLTRLPEPPDSDEELEKDEGD